MTLRCFISHHPKPNQPKGLTALTNAGAISPSLQRLMHSSHAFLHIPKVTSEIKCHFSKTFLVLRQPGQWGTLVIKTSIIPNFETAAIETTTTKEEFPNQIFSLTDGAAAAKGFLLSPPDSCQQNRSRANRAPGYA